MAAAVYTVVAWLMLDISRHTFALDVLVAYVASAVSNYLGARRVFQVQSRFGSHKWRYLATLALSFGLTTILAVGVDNLDLPKLIAAYLPPIIAAVPTFLLLRFWVFRHDRAAANAVTAGAER